MSVNYDAIADQLNRQHLGGRPMLTGAMVQAVATSAGLVDNSADAVQLAAVRAENADLKNLLDRTNRALAAATDERNAANAKLAVIAKDAS